MAGVSPEEVKEMMHKYESKLKTQLLTPKERVEPQPITSREYQIFKEQYMPKHMTAYEKLCNISEKLIKLKPDKKKAAELQENIDICHLNVTPSGVVSASYLFPFAFMLIGVFLSFVVPALLGGETSMFFLTFFIIIGAVLIYPLTKLPEFLAESWRMRASNQMVLCIFYIVTYMRHTSNLELAIEFASNRLVPPLSFDLKKILWDVETERYESIKESLEAYLESWKKWNLEFIESFHLIESSLYEGSEERRLLLLDKSLSTMLDETFEKMLHYAQNLKSPLTVLHMMGIILPILGLVILPLVVSFMEGIKWYHLAMLYNVILPIGVYYFSKTILSKRPTGYGDTDISEENPELKKYKKFSIKIMGLEIGFDPLYVAIFTFMICMCIALSPLVIHALNPNVDYIIPTECENGGMFCVNTVDVTDPIQTRNAKYEFLGYHTSMSKTDPGKIVGPFGLGASLISLLFPLAFGLSIGLYYKLKSQNVIKIRERSKNLEKEFASALFQLGNRLGDGLPAEIAFGKVASVMEGSVSGNFFSVVEANIRHLGMSVEAAIFDPKVGALTQFPSNLIESSMKVLVESAKKGPRIAAEAILNVSRYIKEIHKVDERLKDLLADVISDVKSQITFLTPAIAGIVIGITSMVTTIIGKLGANLKNIQEQAATQQTSLIELFGDGLPTYYFQLIVGLYVVQIIYVLTIMSNGVENGSDKLNEDYLIGQNVTASVIKYTIISAIVILIFNIIASNIIASQMATSGGLG